MVADFLRQSNNLPFRLGKVNRSFPNPTAHHGTLRSSVNIRRSMEDD